tara:strand:+ start:5204 stop:6382 length:1179 start_codon:yes stop_codon:yes gene_type:complete
MAVLLETGYNGTQSGGREDLSDLISNVDARSTVFTSLAKKGKKPGNAVMGWQMDKHDEPDATAYVDGKDVSMTQAQDAANSASSPAFGNPGASRKLQQNYIQLFRRTFRISNLANEIQIVAGVKSELANGIAKKLVSLKRDMEYVFLSDQDADADTGSVGYKTKAMGSFLRRTAYELGSAPYGDLNSENAAYADNDAGGRNGTDFRVDESFCMPKDSSYESTVALLTEADVQNVLKSIYDTTGNIRDYDAVVGTALKRAFTNFTQGITNTLAGSGSGATAIADTTASPIKTFTQDASSKSFINAIDLFEGDFGRLRLHPSTFINEQTSASANAVRAYKGYVIPFDQVEIRYGKLPEIKELTDNGGGPARLIQAIAALIVNNPQNFGYFDCTA